MPSFIYLYKTNYWIGKDIFKKIQNNLSIEVVNKISPEAIYRVITSLESQLQNNPNDIDTIKKIAQAKYMLSDYMGALKAYELGRVKNRNDMELLLGEANIRLFIEKDKISEKTVNLFKEILKQDANNLMGLLVLGDYSYNTNNVLHARKYYDKLLKLLDKDSLEYKKIYKKLESIND
jgi:cytochrome c-type biogenesis protein CcmH/NrfG